jgi:calcineurin-like phosphoesterase family protein
MIYVTGDTHGGEDFGLKKFTSEKWIIGRSLAKDDYVVILGDFGLIWNDSDTERHWLKWLSNKKWTTLFVDGNHENFDRLYQSPVQDFLGGKASEVYPGIWWLRRGEVYIINGYKCFTFGGARSTDRHFRRPGVSWWEREIPDKRDIDNAWKNLKAHNLEVDYVFTHTCPGSVYYSYFQSSGSLWSVNPKPYDEPDVTRDFLENFRKKLKFKHWYFGHYHKNQDCPDWQGNVEFTCLYDAIEPVSITYERQDNKHRHR